MLTDNGKWPFSSGLLFLWLWHQKSHSLTDGLMEGRVGGAVGLWDKLLISFLTFF